jgi:hypothetical protein
MELRELARGSNCPLLGFALFEIEQWRKGDILVMEQDARWHEPEARGGQCSELTLLLCALTEKSRLDIGTRLVASSQIG